MAVLIIAFAGRDGYSLFFGGVGCVLRFILQLYCQFYYILT
jgi:hypothetical protein